MKHWEMARHAAWREFGQRYWKWFVFGPIAARVTGVLVATSGLALGAWWVAQHVGGWLTWLGWLAGAYLLPMLLVGLGVSAYAIGAVIFWRLNGWKWKLSGFTTAKYSVVVMAIMIVGMTLVGVTAI